MHRALALAAAALVALLSVAAAGCGADDQSSAEQWADSVCTDLNTWADSVTTSIRNVMSQGSGVTSADLKAAANQASSATSDLIDGLKQIGPPDTDSGEQAQQQVNQLADQLQQDADQVRSDVENAPSTLAGLLSTAQAVLTQIGSAADQVKSTLTALQRLGSDLRSGIEESDACTELRNKDFTGGS